MIVEYYASLSEYLRTAMFAKRPCLLLTLACLVIGAVGAQAQRIRGELRVAVRDQQGASLAATAELVSDGDQFRRTFEVSADDARIAQDLPFGTYRLRVTAVGFAPWTGLVEIRSEVPARISVVLGVAPVITQVQVSNSATLLDPSETGSPYSLGRQTLSEQTGPQSGRGVSDLVEQLPGWVYEANGVLHPRGSEYDVQYVVDGLPLTQNHSPAFAPSFDVDDVQSLRVLTAGYPAEYGRKLGGVVEVTTGKDKYPGLHGDFVMNDGSFSTLGASGTISYTWSKNTFSLSGNGFRSDRYLDPPVLENFTNHGNSADFSVSYERDFSDRSRLRVTVTRGGVHFLVPNYLVQQDNGQRQDVANSETGGQIYFQHSISPNLFLSFSGSVRDAGAKLSSNPLSVPVIVAQDRGYREGYGRGDLAGHHGRHDWKIGVDSIFSPVREKLQYAIIDPAQFDPGTHQQFRFSDRRWDVEPSAYVQDQIHFGQWNVSAGLRFDHYGFVVNDSAWSPRVGVSRYIHPLNILVHAAYDRVFQTPAIENLLLASSPQLDAINPVVVRLPVQPSRGNYYEVGVSKAIDGKLRLDANVFRRDFRNYSDDDVLLDTGISFPIAFAQASIVGEELRAEVPKWGRFSGYLSYANQTGVGRGPITGGLFLGNDEASGLSLANRFAVSQDQRNTAHMRVRFQAFPRLWLAVGGQYGSGLPADATANSGLLLAQYGTAILDRVDFERGRVRPSFSIDAAAGLEIFRKEQRSAELQIQGFNLTDRLNVLNFASVFSGTAIAPPRSVSARLKLTF